MAAVAVVAVAALVGRELVGGAGGDDDRRPSPTRTGFMLESPAARRSALLAKSLHFVGVADGRLYRVRLDGTVDRGPRLSRPANGPTGAAWAWWNRQVRVRQDGRVLYIADGTLQIAKPDFSGTSRTVTGAARILPCGAGIPQTCVETEDGAVARVRLSDGRIMEAEVVPRKIYADGGWRPWAVLDDALVLVRPSGGDRRSGGGLPRVDVAIVPGWDDDLHVLAKDVRLLGAHGSQIIVWDGQRTVWQGRESGTSTLTSYVVNGAVNEIVRNTVTPPPGARFLPKPAGFLDRPPGAVAYVEGDGTRALAFIEPYGDNVPIVPGSRGADPDAGMARSGSGTVVFAATTESGMRFASATVSGAEPYPRIRGDGVPRRFWLIAEQDCLLRTCVRGG